jgi:hypothetical protein
MEFLFIKDDNDGNRYDIYQDNVPAYYALYNYKLRSTELYSFQSAFLGWGRADRGLAPLQLGIPPFAVELLEEGNPTLVKSRVSFFYKILRDSSYFEYNGSQFKALRHTGNKVSIFQDASQIAAYNTGGLISDKPWNMKLICNHDVFKELLLLFCLYVYSDFFSETGSNGAKSSLAVAILPQPRYNENWTPS